jgi:hypothetical protein
MMVVKLTNKTAINSIMQLSIMDLHRSPNPFSTKSSLIIAPMLLLLLLLLPQTPPFIKWLVIVDLALGMPPPAAPA